MSIAYIKKQNLFTLKPMSEIFFRLAEAANRFTLMMTTNYLKSNLILGDLEFSPG